MRRGVERVQLAKRIDALKSQADIEGDETDIPQDANQAAKEAFSIQGTEKGVDTPPSTPNLKAHSPSVGTSGASSTGSRLSRAAKSEIFRAVVLAKTKELKAQKALEEMELNAASQGGTGASHSGSSHSGTSHSKKPSR